MFSVYLFGYPYCRFSIFLGVKWVHPFQISLGSLFLGNAEHTHQKFGRVPPHPHPLGHINMFIKFEAMSYSITEALVTGL